VIIPRTILDDLFFSCTVLLFTAFFGKNRKLSFEFLILIFLHLSKSSAYGTNKNEI